MKVLVEFRLSCSIFRRDTKHKRRRLSVREGDWLAGSGWGRSIDACPHGRSDTSTVLTSHNSNNGSSP